MQHLCKYLDETDARVSAELISEKLLEATTLSPEEAAAWAERVQGVAGDWAAEMDLTGRPGTQLLEAYRASASQ